jgi:sugar lactone lactonase YvrE
MTPAMSPSNPVLRAFATPMLLCVLALLSACGGGGDSGASATPIVAPAISTQPQNVAANVGQAAAFSVAASGTTPTYQWQRSGVVIAGATNSTYTLAAVTAQDGGATFSVVVSNSAGSVTSNTATLSVNVPPSIASGPADATAATNASAVFSVVANGTAPLVYQWKRNGVALTGATSATLTLQASARHNGSKFTVDVTNVAGTVTTSPAVLHVSPPIALLAGTLGGSGNLDGSTSNARLNVAAGMDIDGLGNISFVDSVSQRVRTLNSSGATLGTLAGKGTSGNADGASSVAEFKFDYGSGGVAYDLSGNLYIADSGNSTIRKLTPSGTVSTLAGVANTVGSSDGAGALALFNHPASIVLARDGNLYVADSGNNAIRRVTLAGVVTTVAGAAASGSADGAGASARFNTPMAIGTCSGTSLCAASQASNFELYVADTGNSTIRRVAVTVAGASESYAVSTLAGSASQTGTADGTGTAARFNSPRGIVAVGSYANATLFVADNRNFTIREIVGNVVTTLAGSPGVSGSSDGTGTGARFGDPLSVSYISGATFIGVVVGDGARLRFVTNSGVVTTLAGKNASVGYVDASGTAARFATPRHIAADAAGSMYVADQFNNAVRKITPSGVVTTLAGGAGTSSAGLTPVPFAIAVDSSAVIWVTGGTGLLKIGTSGAVTNFVGTNGSGGTATIATPDALAADDAGNVYVTDGCVIRRISAAGVVSAVAGGTCGYADGTGTGAQFLNPRGLAVDATGTLFVADSENYLIRKITANGVVTTLAGMPGSSGTADGNGSAARFGYIWGIAVDAAGNVYAADRNNHTIRRIDPSRNVTTVVGSALSVGVQPGALPGALNNPFGIATLPGSNSSLVITDDSEGNIVTVSFP